MLSLNMDLAVPFGTDVEMTHSEHAEWACQRIEVGYQHRPTRVAVPLVIGRHNPSAGGAVSFHSGGRMW